MYYGIAYGAKVYIDCKMADTEIHVYDPLSHFKIGNEREWKLTSYYEGVEAEVILTTSGYSDNRVIISLLLAGLKQIEDSPIYSASVSAIETKLGFIVDRDIPAGVGEIVSTSLYKDSIRYEINILCGANGSFENPNFHLQHIIDTQTIRFVMEVVLNSQKVSSWIDFHEDEWFEGETQCFDYAKSHLLTSIYQEKYSPALSYLKYEMFDGDGNKYIHPDKKDMTWTNNVGVEKLSTGKFHNSAGAVGEDDRVSELPGLNQMVRNPVTNKTGTLRSVIISLNDNSKWTRERIADWLDTLDVDITFRTKED